MTEREETAGPGDAIIASIAAKDPIYAEAMRVGKSTGNRHMRHAGRTEWDESDYSVAARKRDEFLYCHGTTRPTEPKAVAAKCPFCRGEHVSCATKDGLPTTWFGECGDCHARGPSVACDERQEFGWEVETDAKYRVLAIEAWNRRTP